ncbi:MAG: hypothetical protein AAGJ37_01190 [Pseudomonadota bacterium]
MKKYTRHGVFEIEMPLYPNNAPFDFIVDVTHWYLERSVADVDLHKSTSQSLVVGRRVFGIIRQVNIAHSIFKKGDRVLVVAAASTRGLFVRKLFVTADQLTRCASEDRNVITQSARPATSIHEVLKQLTQMEIEGADGRWIKI